MPDVTVRSNGPYLVGAEGLTLTDQNGKPIPLPAGAKVALCRCGGSANKPFCDGTHNKIGFQHDPTAPSG